jgi:hypothetical protein
MHTYRGERSFCTADLLHCIASHDTHHIERTNDSSGEQSSTIADHMHWHPYKRTHAYTHSFINMQYSPPHIIHTNVCIQPAETCVHMHAYVYIHNVCIQPTHRCHSAHACIHTYTRTYTYIETHARICIHSCTYTNVYNPHTHVIVRMHACTYRHMHAYLYIHTCIQRMHTAHIHMSQ